MYVFSIQYPGVAVMKIFIEGNRQRRLSAIAVMDVFIEVVEVGQ